MRNTPVHSCAMFWYRSSRLVTALGLVLGMFGCQISDHSAVVRPQVWDDWAVGQVLDAKTGQAVSMGTWLKELATYDVIYLGEEHHNRFHIDAALTVLQSLVGQGRRPLLAMEMFGWDGQPALDRYLTSRSSLAGARSEFLEQVHWKQNWGGAYDDYEPLVQFAKEQHLPLQAMNPPKTLIRQVVKQGLIQARESPEWRQWGMAGEAIVDTPAYRTRILSQLQDCHGGGSPEDYQTMYEASMVRDEGMAKMLVEAVTRVHDEANPVLGPVFSYTGGGHVQFRLPVPNRVVRRFPDNLRQVTVYMATFERPRAAELWQVMQEGIADYVWLTPQGSQGPPRRCR